jgi:anti-sigma B factor antagonist
VGLTCVIKGKSSQRPFPVLQLTGSVDSSTAEKLGSFLGLLVEKSPPRVIVDLSQVDYVSSAGWRAFLGAVRSASASKVEFAFVGMQTAVQDVFELLGLERVITAHPTVAAAVRASGAAKSSS